MSINDLVAVLNKGLRLVGGEIVTHNAARHMRMVRDLQQTGAQLDLLNLAIKNELNALRGCPFNIVQIGANDGSRYDPYRPHIEKYHFSGVLVEPIPAVYKKLVQNYKEQTQLRFENAAIGPEEGNLPLYMLWDENGNIDELSVFASFNEQEVLKCKKRADRSLRIDSLLVPVITFSQLLKKHEINAVSLLAIDTEGFDYQILQSINFHKIRPKIIEYEHSHLAEKDEQSCIKLLNAMGYELHRYFGDDTIAVLREQ
jgi:FkbM family methyltransferase